MRTTRRATTAACVILLSAATIARAQTATDEAIMHTARQIARQAATDPTSYAPAAALYISARLDWATSQPLFARGYVEQNAAYTVSGRSGDVPVSDAEGRRRILIEAVKKVPIMFGANAASQLGERMLLARWPNHARAIHAIGWIERAAFSAFLSYHLSAGHIAQWGANREAVR